MSQGSPPRMKIVGLFSAEYLMSQGSPPRMKIVGLFSAEYPWVFLVADVPKNVVAMSYKKTRRKINASLTPLLRAFLAHTGW